MGTGIDPTVDYAFKRVFGCEENRDVLTELLNAVLAGSGVRPIREVELLNPFSAMDAVDDRLAILDIKAKDDQERECLVEMQMLAHANFRERLLWYVSKSYAAMLNKGEDYSALKPVVLVCFMNDILIEDSDRFHSRYELREPETGARFSDHISIHIIELPKFNKTLDELRDSLDQWSYFLKHGAELDPLELPPQLQNCGITKATGTLEMLSRNTEEHWAYDARRMFQMDQAARLQTAIAKGEARGIAKGEALGKQSGIRDAICSVGRSRLGEPSASTLLQLAEITDVNRLKELLERALDCSSWESLLTDELV